mmetsp:Transcript_28211/g.86459  ORF Transcript_28211/g.86459 Transcript_28211/m.86459 type:complete len:331 (+) Transcript_28211:615-1607(+)
MRSDDAHEELRHAPDHDPDAELGVAEGQVVADVRVLDGVVDVGEANGCAHQCRELYGRVQRQPRLEETVVQEGPLAAREEDAERRAVRPGRHHQHAVDLDGLAAHGLQVELHEGAVRQIQVQGAAGVRVERETAAAVRPHEAVRARAHDLDLSGLGQNLRVAVLHVAVRQDFRPDVRQRLRHARRRRPHRILHEVLLGQRLVGADDRVRVRHERVQARREASPPAAGTRQLGHEHVARHAPRKRQRRVQRQRKVKVRVVRVAAARHEGRRRRLRRRRRRVRVAHGIQDDLRGPAVAEGVVLQGRGVQVRVQELLRHAGLRRDVDAIRVLH